MFAAFKGWFTDAKQYFVSLVAALAAFLAFQAFLAGQFGVPKWTAWLPRTRRQSSLPHSKFRL
jgi:hypothetical protein